MEQYKRMETWANEKFFSSTDVFSSKMRVQIDKYKPLKADAADAEKPSANH